MSKKPVIICVDDEQTILDSLEIELQKALENEFLIETAVEAEEALDLMEELIEGEYEVPLIISDHIMPGLKGDELLSRIHSMAPQTLKIMLTGQADLEAVGNAIKHAKLYRYISKPWQSEDLKLTLKEAVNSYFREKLLAEYNRNLEIQVAQRTRELSEALEKLKAAQEELVQSEKMAALGQLIAGVAHEINTPLGAIRSSIENISDFLIVNLQHLPVFFQELSPQRQQDFFALLQKSIYHNESLSSKEKRQLKRSIKQQLDGFQVGNSDILASILVNIGVIDEIEAFLPLFKDPDNEKILKTAYDFASVQKSTKTITTATDRAAKIVFALKSYSRYNNSGEKVQAKLRESIETVLMLYHNQLKQGVEIIRNYAELPEIWCYPDELNQVWTNLIHNSLQAMEYKGILKIDTNQENGNVLVSITDNGPGIPLEIMEKIFQPFFTTKPTGEGSGLGLDIVRKIVEKHQGKITVDSKPGQTKFTVFLPL